MFGRDDVYATVQGFTVRVKDERQQDKNHLVESTFEVPLTFELMDGISPVIAKDLFNTVKGEHTPKPELNDVGLNLAPEPQLVIVKNHPELDPEVRIAGANVRKVRAKKGEGNTWLLVFTVTWTLGDPREVYTMIQRLKQGVYLTLHPQEPTLDLGAEAVPAGDGATATVDGSGNVTDITKGRKRQKQLPAAGGADAPKKKGRTKRTSPEAEGQAQQEDGAARQALPDPDSAADDSPAADSIQ